MEITEKVKRKTTLKKKIIHEREKNDFLKKQEEDKKDSPSIEISTPAQVLGEIPPTKSTVREYVDQILSEQIDLNVIDLIFSLRKQYSKQKLEKPGKTIQKNYVFGIKEVQKHIEAKYILTKS